MSIPILFLTLICFIAFVLIITKINKRLKSKEVILTKLRYVNGVLSFLSFAGNFYFWYLSFIILTSKSNSGYGIYILLTSGIATLFIIPAILGLQYGTNKNLVILILNLAGVLWIYYWLIQLLVFH
ncbi:MAG: hypothetical protein J7604_20590 [Sporocytophaga sp.]|uniref:hypothetical protein n=1 Tax=Sporocytophaga sp. TaxID=2231183 RepID=UPI001B06FA57|nr:hypothetical protein [Sporocytophaga sp.]MBO9702622.1 hypothetical protein [Sporocytophaga sp.]